jgi:hypothetical protein
MDEHERFLVRFERTASKTMSAEQLMAERSSAAGNLEADE